MQVTVTESASLAPVLTRIWVVFLVPIFSAVIPELPILI